MKIANYSKGSILSIFALLILSYAPVAMSQDSGDAKAEIGVMTCKLIPGSKVNLLIHSSAGFNCVFDHGGTKEEYKGEAGIALGIDLQWNDQSTMAYSVMASTGTEVDWGTALEGTYTGAKASAALGVGAGAAILVGGGDEGVALVPLALEGSQGVGATAGLGYLTLQAR